MSIEFGSQVKEEHKMSAVLQFTAQLETQTCGECGIEFAAPATFWRERRERNLHWYCPNGHNRVFRETDSEKLRKEMQKQIDAEKNRVEFFRRENEAKKRELTAAKGALTKVKNRIKNGVCPVCKRSFVALGRHMQGQHPDFCGKENI